MPEPPAPFRILPLGDSITEGTVAGGYRAPLYAALVADGFTVAYVGDQTTNPGGGLPAGQDRHEGFPSETSVQLQSQIDTSGIVQTSQPNAVLLLVGTNDVGYGASIPTTNSNIAALMDDIISKAPPCTFSCRLSCTGRMTAADGFRLSMRPCPRSLRRGRTMSRWSILRPR